MEAQHKNGGSSGARDEELRTPEEEKTKKKPSQRTGKDPTFEALSRTTMTECICATCELLGSKAEEQGKKLRKCQKCGNVFYCSEQCSQKDWDRHRPLCNFARGKVTAEQIAELSDARPVCFMSRCDTTSAFQMKIFVDISGVGQYRLASLIIRNGQGIRSGMMLSENFVDNYLKSCILPMDEVRSSIGTRERFIVPSPHQCHLLLEFGINETKQDVFDNNYDCILFSVDHKTTIRRANYVLIETSLARALIVQAIAENEGGIDGVPRDSREVVQMALTLMPEKPIGEIDPLNQHFRTSEFMENMDFLQSLEPYSAVATEALLQMNPRLQRPIKLVAGLLFCLFYCRGEYARHCVLSYSLLEDLYQAMKDANLRKLPTKDPESRLKQMLQVLGPLDYVARRCSTICKHMARWHLLHGEHRLVALWETARKDVDNDFGNSALLEALAMRTVHPSDRGYFLLSPVQSQGNTSDCPVGKQIRNPFDESEREHIYMTLLCKDLAFASGLGLTEPVFFHYAGGSPGFPEDPSLGIRDSKSVFADVPKFKKRIQYFWNVKKTREMRNMQPNHPLYHPEDMCTE